MNSRLLITGTLALIFSGCCTPPEKSQQQLQEISQARQIQEERYKAERDAERSHNTKIIRSKEAFIHGNLGPIAIVREANTEFVLAAEDGCVCSVDADDYSRVQPGDKFYSRSWRCKH